MGDGWQQLGVPTGNVSPSPSRSGYVTMWLVEGVGVPEVAEGM